MTEEDVIDVQEEADADDDDGFIVSIEEIIEDAAEKVKAPFEWLLGKPR